MSSTEPKQYGLILPSKNKGKGAELGTRKLNPLLDSDDELDQDEESPLNWVEASLKDTKRVKSAGNSGQQSLQKRLLREALEEDKSVFQYDEVYDSMQEAKNVQQAVKDPSLKKPKYIQNLIKHAEKRKLEGERRNERKVQKEREAEGEEFADKESFVTPSYLKKMEELKKAEEEAKLQELREEQVDVMKHKNFGVFYNHLFKQRMGEVSVKEEPKSDDNEEEEAPKDKNVRKKDEIKRQKHYRTQRDLSESPERREQENTRAPRHNSPTSSDSDTPKKMETYRDRREQYNAMERSREIEREKKHHRYQNSDKSRERRGRSRDRHHGRRTPEQDRRHRGKHRSRSSDRKQRHSRSRSPASQRGSGISRGDRSPRRVASTSKTDNARRPIKKERLSSDREESKESTENKNDKKTKANSSEGKTTHVDGVKIKKESDQEEKEKRQGRIRKLFTKRTVGARFDEALQRYYMRKAEREAQG